MRRLALVVLGVGAYAVFLVAMLPASFVAPRIAGATRGTLQLHNADGTVWNGSARAVVATPAGPLAIDELRWRLVPLRLATGRLAYAVDAASAGFKATGEVGRGFAAWYARGLRVAGDAAGAASFLPLVTPWNPRGAVSLEVAEASWNGSDLKGSAAIEWDDVSLALSEVRPLGSYRAELRGSGGPARFALLTVKGPLQLAGHGTFAPPARFEFVGNARAEGTHGPALKGVLDLLGPRRPDGAHGVEWRTAPAPARQ